MNYYTRHVGDYTKDTAHLSMLEHGAYNLLLDRYYATEEGIPNEQRYRVARARSEDEKAAVDAVLSEFFELVNDRWNQKRCEEVLADHHAFIEQQRINGRASAVKRSLNRGSTIAANNPAIVEPSLSSGTNRTSTEGQPEGNLPLPTSHFPLKTKSPNGSHEPSPSKVLNGGGEPSAPKVTTPRARVSRKTPIPDGFTLDAELAAYVTAKIPDANASEMFEAFCGAARAKGWTYSDWRQAWQTYVRNCAPNSGHWAAGQYPKQGAAGVRWM